MKIKITLGGLVLHGELNDSPTALKVSEILPISTPFNTWGEEIYFGVPVRADLDDTAREIVELGDLGYWPSGSAFCIFFGMTPMSSPGKIVPAGPVNIIGRLSGDVEALKDVMDESEIRVEAV